MIEARGLGKRYGDRWAVRDLTFSVRAGSVTGFLGLNGAGKSTTLRLMLGLENGLGSTTFGGRAYRDLDEPARRVGALVDFQTLHPRIPGRKQIAWYARAASLPSSRVDEVLDQVGMAGEAERAPREYSLGMKQRMGIAIALIGDPDVLILDEPGNGMDPQGQRWIADLVRDYAQSGRTVLMSSHSLAEVQRVADHVVVIDQGELVSSSTTEEFVGQFATSTVRVRCLDPVAVEDLLTRSGAVVVRREADVISVTGTTTERVARLAFDAGLLLVGLSDEPSSLEDAFLTASGAATVGAMGVTEGVL